MINDFINTIIPSVEHFGIGGYWIAFFAALLETTVGIGLFLPGSTIILLLGAISARGYLDLGDLLWFAVAGAIIGDNINYYLGKRYGAKWLKKSIPFLKPQYLEKGMRFMDAHGAKSVFLGRFIPSVKEIIPFIAGSARMPKKKFLLWNVLGAIGWGFEYVLAGYIFAQSLDVAELWLSRTGLFFAFILFLSGLLYFLKRLIIKKGTALLVFVGSISVSINQAILNNEYVVRWMQNHPRSISFFQARMDTAAFTGMPLTILTIAFVYVLALFGGIVEGLITSEPIVAVDIHIANILAVFRTDTLTNVFTWITLLGKSQVIFVFIAVSVALMWLWRKSPYIIPLFVAVIGSAGFTYLGKLAFHRTRPEMAVYAEPSFSFPSSHATIAVAFYGFLSYLLVRFTPNWKMKVNLFFTGLVVILAIGLSRLYLGVHYLSDVWSGYLVGTMWLIIAISLSEWIASKKGKHESLSPIRSVRLLSLGLGLAAVAFYVAFALKYQPIPAISDQSNKLEVVSNILNVFADEQLKYTETLIGEKQEPISFIFIVKSDRQLVELFDRAGWNEADRLGFSSFLEIVKAAFVKTGYSSTPISPSFWNGKIQDFNFTKPTDTNTFGHAHHAKVWKTNLLSEKALHIYVGLANATNGVKWGVIPKISPDIDAERDLLFQDLNRSDNLTSYHKIQLVDPQIGRNFSGDQFFTDGMAYIISVQ
jgi:membrane protein DedA with SNARE-associated domain